MPRKLTIDLDKDTEALLDLMVRDINRDFNAKWTAETLAASFLAQVIMETEMCECPPRSKLN